jgi:hypothetical protein
MEDVIADALEHLALEELIIGVRIVHVGKLSWKRTLLASGYGHFLIFVSPNVRSCTELGIRSVTRLSERTFQRGASVEFAGVADCWWAN